MNSRDRVAATFNHQQPDKMAVDFGSHATSGIHVNTMAMLRDLFGLEKKRVTLLEPYTMLGRMDQDLQEAMHTDCVGGYYPKNAFGIPVEPLTTWTTPQGTEINVPVGLNPQPDGQGGWYIYPQGDQTVPASGHMPANGFYFDAIVRQQPFEEEDLKAEDNLEEWKELSEEDLAGLKKSVDNARKTGRYVVISLPGAGLGDIAEIPGVGLKYPKGIRSIDEWYVSPLLRPELVEEIFEKQMNILIKNVEKINKYCGDSIDAVLGCATDFGTQNSLFISVDTYRNIYLPHHKFANDFIHKNTNWKIIKHSCGAVEPLIPYFIEAGFDALNPVQCSATGMDPVHLKKMYGKDIVFWGAGVDTQHVLPFGTPEDVRKQVIERCEIFAKDGGFVFNTIHCLQSGIPIENLEAMLKAIREFNGD